MKKIIFFIFKKIRNIDRFLIKSIRLFFIKIGNTKFLESKLYGKLSFLKDNFYRNVIYKRLKPDQDVFVDTEVGKLCLSSKDSGISYLISMDEFLEKEKYETSLFESMLKSGMIVVNVGANFGYYSILAAKLVGPTGKVYAFEPSSDNFEILLKSIKINNYSNIFPIKNAVSNKCSKQKLWIDEEDSAISSFSKENVLAFSQFEDVKNSEEVEVVSLDYFFQNKIKENKIDVIKMDTQGAEGLIIEGAQKIIKCNNLKILMEFWPAGLKRVGTDPINLLLRLKSAGFKIKCIQEDDQSIKLIDNIYVFFGKNGKNDKEYSLLLEK